MRDYTPDPRLYEMMTILSPDVPEDDLPAQIEAIAGYIRTAGGTVNETLRDSPWGRRRLAYSIRHTGRDIRDGFYTVFHFTLDPGGVRDIERDLKLNDQVMRFLITHYTPKPEVPGAATEGVPTGTDEGEAPTTADTSAADTSAADFSTAADSTAAETEQAAEAAGTTDGSNEATAAVAADETAAASIEAEAAGSEAAPSTDSLTEIAVPAEASDTEAAATSSEPTEVGPASEEALPAEAEPADEAPAEEAPATDEGAAEEASDTDETPTEPTAPAKDDQEA